MVSVVLLLMMSVLCSSCVGSRFILGERDVHPQLGLITLTQKLNQPRIPSLSLLIAVYLQIREWWWWCNPIPHPGDPQTEERGIPPTTPTTHSAVKRPPVIEAELKLHTTSFKAAGAAVVVDSPATTLIH